MYWEYYGTYAQGSFDGIGYNQNATYSFTIYKKNYRGVVFQCVCAGNPATLRYLADDPTGIKGSELVLNLINIDNQLPLSYFYAEEDDTFKVEFKITYEVSSVQTTKTLFTGFLIQEDSNEILSDIAHEIQLSFTDNLGSLKDIDFYEASKLSPKSASDLRSSTANITVVVEQAQTSGYVGFNNNQSFGNAIVGDFIFLNDTPIGDVSYEIIKIEIISGIKRHYIRDKTLGFALTSNLKFSFIAGSNVYGYIKLKDALRICLHATGSNLDVKYAGNLTALSDTQQSDTNFWDSIYIDGRTFMQDQNKWMSCYEVLERICRRFNISLYQQDNCWYMVRIFELPFYSNVIPGRTYNGYFEAQSTGNITSQLSFGNETDIESGIEQSLIRPFQYYSESLNYKNVGNLLYNADLQILGAKIQSYSTTIDGVSHTVKEYAAPGFTLNASFTGQYSIFIRIWVNDVTGAEYDRVLVVKEIGQQPTNIEIAISEKIEINNNSNIKISFSYRTLTSNTNENNKFAFRSSINTTLNDHYYVSNIKKEITNEQQFLFISYPLLIFPVDYFTDGFPSSENSQDWRDINITTGPTRQSGFYLGLGQWDRTISTLGETWYKNLKVEVIEQSGGNSKTKGHEHKSSINKILKNKDSKEIYLDDTDKNSIAGTFIFGTSMTNLTRRRTRYWMDSIGGTMFKLGEVTTREVMNWKLKPRTKLEARILGIIKANDSRYQMFNALLFQVNNSTFYIFGKAEFNFRNDTINCTLYELYKTGEYQGTGTLRNDVLYNYKNLFE